MSQRRARNIANECVNKMIDAGVIENKNELYALDLITKTVCEWQGYEFKPPTTSTVDGEKGTIRIKCHGEPMDRHSPFLLHEEDEWFTVLHDSGHYKSGTPTAHSLNIWLDDQTDKWQWALYDLAWWNTKSLDTAIAHGNATQPPA